MGLKNRINTIMSSTKLHIAVKDILDQLGVDTLEKKIFMNVLSDYAAFEEYPATKPVLKDVVTEGYGQKIFQAYKRSDKSVLSEINSCSKEFKKSHTYKADIVDYVFSSLAFGLGISSSVDEPYSTGLNPNARSSSGLLSELPGMLAKLKKEYEEKVQSLLVRPKDIVWDAAAYYTAESENELYLLAGKIQVISLQLGKPVDSAFLRIKDDVLAKAKKDKSTAVKKAIDSKKNEYSSALNKAYLDKETAFTAKGPALSSKSRELLSKIKDEIKSLYAESNTAYDHWCQHLEDKKFDSYRKEHASAYNAELSKKRTDYTKLINGALVKKTFFISRNAFFANDKISDINLLEVEIKELYDKMLTPYDDWCERQKRTLLGKYKVSVQRQILEVSLKIILPVLILLELVSSGYNYVSSADERNAYNVTMRMAEHEKDKGELNNAIASFMSAGESYDASFNAASYKDDAMRQADKCFETLQSQIDEKIAIGEIAESFRLITSIPHKYLETSQEKQDWVDKKKIELDNSIDAAVEKIAEQISSNDGTMSDETRKQIDELLKYSPNNYWLNFLKKK